MSRLRFQRKERGKSDFSTILCGFGQVISGQDTSITVPLLYHLNNILKFIPMLCISICLLAAFRYMEDANLLINIFKCGFVDRRRSHSFDLDWSDIGTILESRWSDCCYATWKVNGGQTGASNEWTPPYFCNTHRDFDGSQFGTITKSIFSNMCYALGDNCIPAPYNQLVIGCFNEGITIISRIIMCITGINFYRSEAAAPCEGISSDSGYTLGNNNWCQIRTIIESIICNGCYALWYNCVLASGNECICGSLNDGVATISWVIIGIVCINLNWGEI